MNTNMPSTNYLWEKVTVAVDCLASGTGSFESRLHDAYISAIMRLDLKDPPPHLTDDLRWILEFCERRQSATGMSQISEPDRRTIVEKLIHILIETSRLTA